MHYSDSIRGFQDILAGGWNVLFTDVDAVFLRNPFDYYDQRMYDLELCSDAPYIAPDYKNNPMMVPKLSHCRCIPNESR